MSIRRYQLTIVILFLLFLIMTGISIFLLYRNSLSERTSESVISPNKNIASTEILFRTPVVATPIPITMRVLKPNALTLWSLYIRERYNRTGNLSDNGHMMYVLDIPSEVFCYLGSDDYNWLPVRHQSWILSCKRYDNTEPITFMINGTAAEGLTGGIYYGTTDPLYVYGMGDWPEFCYTVDVTPTITPILSDRQELDKTPSPTGTSLSYSLPNTIFTKP